MNQRLYQFRRRHPAVSAALSVMLLAGLLWCSGPMDFVRDAHAAPASAPSRITTVQVLDAHGLDGDCTGHYLIGPDDNQVVSACANGAHSVAAFEVPSLAFVAQDLLPGPMLLSPLNVTRGRPIPVPLRI